MNVSSHRKVSKMGGCRTIGQEVSNRRQGLRQTLPLLQLHVPMVLLLFLDFLDSFHTLAPFHHHIQLHECLVANGKCHRTRKRYSIGGDILYILYSPHELSLILFQYAIYHSENMGLPVGLLHMIGKAVELLFFFAYVFVLILLLNATPNMRHIWSI